MERLRLELDCTLHLLRNTSTLFVWEFCRNRPNRVRSPTTYMGCSLDQRPNRIGVSSNGNLERANRSPQGSLDGSARPSSEKRAGFGCASHADVRARAEGEVEGGEGV